MASSSIVIKVKFGETLRRLNASINDKKLVLDMVMLKEKIRSLFSFGSDVEFTMTYVDEDGDEVTLADDGDIIDVVKQSLNPLRITVHLNSSNLNGPSGNFTPLPQNQHPLQSLNSGVSEILKSIPEPLIEALAKLPLDLASKASSSSAPAVAELVQKMKSVYSNQILPSMVSPRVHPTTGGSSNANSKSSTVKISKVQVNPEAGGSNIKKKEMQVQKIAEGVKFKDVQSPKDVDLNVPYFEYGSFQTPVSCTKGVGEGSTGKNKDTSDGVEKKKDSSSEKDDISGGSLNEPLKHDSFVEYINQVWQNQKNEMKHLPDQFVAQRVRYAQLAADINKNANDSGSSLGSAQGMLNTSNKCPFSGMPLTTDSDSQGYHCRSWKRYNSGKNDMGNVFHRGIICDGCGVHPITGPRFKSKVKINYDLCNICFTEMGNATDYIRMDHPTNSFRHSLVPSKGFHDPFLRLPPSALPDAMRTPGLKQSWSKLDSQFMLDANVLDGTIMAPLTAFTKTWRMKNNGSINWPYGSQLQWVGGDYLSKSLSVDVEIPVDGLPVDKEVHISVDFTAPGLPGRYVSYWMMASPSGQKFGQRVWVIIEVDASIKNWGETPVNLNLPPLTKDLEAVNQERLVANIFSGDSIITDPENTSGSLPRNDQEIKFPSNDSMNIDNDGVSSTMGTVLGSLPVGPTATSGLDNEPINYPAVDFSVSSGAASLPTVVVQPPLGYGSQVVSDEQERALLKDLETMGFKNLDLNKEILRMDGYDLEKSIDDLCGILEWDPMLDELREMGFVDDEVNRRLLKKNNGSIKGVVMDLINEGKA